MFPPASHGGQQGGGRGGSVPQSPRAGTQTPTPAAHIPTPGPRLEGGEWDGETTI